METTPRGRAGSVHPVGSRKDDTKTEETNQTTCIPTQMNTYKQTLISGSEGHSGPAGPDVRCTTGERRRQYGRQKGPKKEPPRKGGRAGQREGPVTAMQKPHNRKERDSPGRRRGQKQQTS